MDFTIVMADDCVAGTVIELDDVVGMAEPPGGVPVTVAVLITDPASRSAWVTVWTAVQVVDAPTARVLTGQEIEEAFGSLTEREPSGT